MSQEGDAITGLARGCAQSPPNQRERRERPSEDRGSRTPERRPGFMVSPLPGAKPFLKAPLRSCLPLQCDSSSEAGSDTNAYQIAPPPTCGEGKIGDRRSQSQHATGSGLAAEFLFPRNGARH